MEQRLRAGLIGLGKQGLEEHLPALLQSDQVDVVAVADPSEAARQRCRDAVHEDFVFFTSGEELLRSADLDLVVMAVPHGEYARLIRLAGENGVHVLKEKPFARDIDEAREILAGIEHSGISVMTTFQRRFDPLYEAFVSMKDRLGVIHHVSATYCLSSKTPNGGWRSRGSVAGGGVLLDMGYHIIDMLIWFFDPISDVYSLVSRNVASDYDTEDTASVSFRIGSTVGSLFVSCVSPINEERFIVHGERGSIVLTKNSLQRRNLQNIVVEELNRPNDWNGAMINQLDYFAHVVRGESSHTYSTPRFQVNNHMRIIDACYRSSRTGVVEVLLE